jgi:hypothetical protein
VGWLRGEYVPRFKIEQGEREELTMARLALLEPGHILDKKTRADEVRAVAQLGALRGSGYAGSVGEGDELFFPHVESCCALMVFGDKRLVGGHMGIQYPDVAVGYAAAGKKVWTLVAAEHKRLNSKGGALVMLGDLGWFTPDVKSEVLRVLAPTTCLFRYFPELGGGFNVIARMDKGLAEPIFVQACSNPGKKKNLPLPSTKDPADQELPL